MDKKPFLIGICGGSGSGKTSFIRKLREDFSTDDLCIISQDDYYKPRDKQKSDLNGILNFDLPRSIEKKDFFNDIQKLLDYRSIFTLYLILRTKRLIIGNNLFQTTNFMRFYGKHFLQ